MTIGYPGWATQEYLSVRTGCYSEVDEGYCDVHRVPIQKVLPIRSLEDGAFTWKFKFEIGVGLLFVGHSRVGR